MKRFAKVLVLTIFLASSIQGCSWLSQKWDDRPSWMGGESADKE